MNVETDMKVAVLTMAYNETINLPIWIKYYGDNFGRQNLYLLDHGSDDGSTAHLDINRFVLPRGALDEVKRARLVSCMHKSLLQSFDCVIYTDADEILLPDPACYPSLSAYLERNYRDVVGGVGLNIIHQQDREPALDTARPVLQQRSWVQFVSDGCKPLVARIPVAWAPGFHSCDAPLNIDPDLYLFHLKLMDFDLSLQRLELTRSILWSDEAIQLGHSVQHRFGQEEFQQKYFSDEMRYVVDQNLPFDFHYELRDVTRRPGVVTPHYEGKIARIPDRFAGTF